MAGFFSQLGKALDEAVAATDERPNQQSVPNHSRRSSAGPEEAAVKAALDTVLALWASGVLVILYLLARQVFLLIALAALGAAYVSNPAHSAPLRDRVWPKLLAARTELLAAQAQQNAAQGNFLSALKGAVLDGGLRAVSGQRFLLDLHFFAVAFLDSAARVDQELLALGAFGEWRVLQSTTLRELAAGRVRESVAEAELHRAAAS